MSGEKKSSRSPYLLISAIAFIVLGIAVIVFKSTIVKEINDIIKWVAVGILGIIAIVNIISFVKNTKENIKELIIGILSFLAAILLLISNNVFHIESLVLTVIGVMLGLYLIVEGFYKFKASVKSKKNSVKAWFVPLILGILSIVFGVGFIYCSIFYSAEATAYVVVALGILFIYAGIQNIVNMFFNTKD